MLWLALILSVPYFFTLQIILRHYLAKRKIITPGKPDIRVSVIIACRNEQEIISPLLASLNGQDYPKNLFEIIIIDDHSSDLTVDVALKHSAGIDLKIVKNEGYGKKKAINTGIKSAAGELILCTDADCILNNSWIKTIVSYYKEDFPDMILAPVNTGDAGGFFGKFQQLEFLSLQAITAGTALAGNPVMCNGANIAFTRKAYFENETNLHYDIPTGDDVFLLHSLKARKGRVVWAGANRAAVWTRPSQNLISFLKQRQRWASKSFAYRDIFTIVLGIMTIAVNIGLIGFLAASIVNRTFIMPLVLLFLFKSIPDFLLLWVATGESGERKLLRWFLPAQLIYPFYVLLTSFLALLFPVKNHAG